jgi:NRPS condensation-like uncharacterized protein
MELAAEVFDQLQLLFDRTGYNDHQLHCVLKFEQGLNATVLKQAVIASIAAIPILGTRYCDGDRPRWTRLAPDRFADAFIVARTQKEFDRQVVSRVDERRGPQIQVCLLASSHIAVALTMNHMVCDAAGFKEYLYFLCSIYSALLADPGYQPIMINGDRSMRGVLKHIGVGVKIRSLLTQGRQNNRSGDHRFPLSRGSGRQPFVMTRKINRGRTTAFMRYCRVKGATLNDGVLTAFYRSLFRILDLQPDDTLCIPVMVDMRRYFGAAERWNALSNLSSTVITRLTCKTGEGFEVTLARVKAEMDEKKRSNIGLNAFIKLHLVYQVLKSKRANRLVGSSLKNPLICMTNVGILDSSRIAFGDLHPCDAFMCGSIKYKPHFQLAMSSYEDELTLSVNLYGGSGDRDRVLSFFDAIEEEFLLADRITSKTHT